MDCCDVPNCLEVDGHGDAVANGYMLLIDTCAPPPRRFGDLSIKRAVPLALAVVSASNPKLEVLDTLNKLSHDADADVAQNAILGLGFIGAGVYLSISMYIYIYIYIYIYVCVCVCGWCMEWCVCVIPWLCII